LRRHGARETRPERFETGRGLARRYAHVRRVAERDGFLHVEAVLVGRDRLSETIDDDEPPPPPGPPPQPPPDPPGPRTDLRVARIRRLPEQPEHPEHHADRDRGEGGSLHPIPFSRTASSRMTPTTVSRARAPASARRPPSRKAFRIL